MKRYILIQILLLSFVTQIVNAQQTPYEDQSNSKGLNEQVVITKDRENVVPPAYRTYPKVDIDIKKEKFEAQSYDFNDYSLKVPDVESKIKILGVKEVEKPSNQKGFVRLGFGNYVSPRFDVAWSDKVGEKFFYSINAGHWSWKNGPTTDRKSGFSNNFLNFNTKHIWEKYIYSNELSYNRKGLQFYGFRENEDLNKESNPQIWNSFLYTTSLNTTPANSSDYVFNTKLSYGFLTAYTWTTENEIAVNHVSSFNMDANRFILGDVDFSYSNRAYRTLSQNRFLLQLKPQYQLLVSGFKVKAGFNMAFDNDTVENANVFHLYPLASASKEFLKGKLFAELGIKGGIEKNNVRTLVNENPFVNNLISLANTNNKFTFFANARAKVIKNLTFTGDFKIANYTNYYFWVNDSVNRAKFKPLFESGSTTHIQLNTEFRYNVVDKWYAGVKYQFNNYNSSTIKTPFAKPINVIDVNAGFILNKKIYIDFDWVIMQGIKTLEPRNKQVVDLKTISDINLKLDYRFSDKFSSFLEINNLLSQKYSRYLYYPVRGINVMLGLTYQF